MKIIITESQSRIIINELFSEKLQQNLIQKFQAENPKLEDRVIRFYIDRFQQLKNGPKIQEKDITKYTWKQLETIVDVNQPKTIKDTTIKISNSDIIYNENGLKVFLANSQKACVKYGNGYNFCISARGEENMYGNYRFDEDYTIYFILDEQKTKELKPDGRFVDPTHLIVLMVKIDYEDMREYDDEYEYKHGTPEPEAKTLYQITTANNDGETNYDDWNGDLVYDYPRLKGLQHLFVTHDPNPKEKQLYNLKTKYDAKLTNFNEKHRIENPFPPLEEHNVRITNIDSFNFVNDIIDKNEFYEYTGFSKITKKKILMQTKPHYIEPQEWKDKMNKEMFGDFNEMDESDTYFIGDAKVQKRIPSEQYLKYLIQVREIMLEYLHEKNKLNYQQ